MRLTKLTKYGKQEEALQDMQVDGTGRACDSGEQWEGRRYKGWHVAQWRCHVGNIHQRVTRWQSTWVVAVALTAKLVEHLLAFASQAPIMRGMAGLNPIMRHTCWLLGVCREPLGQGPGASQVTATRGGTHTQEKATRPPPSPVWQCMPRGTFQPNCPPSV